MDKAIWVTILIDFCWSEPVGKLLIVSFDGFRSDFFDRTNTPNFHEFIKKSAYREKVLNVFPTLTFPNHFSIATGLYAEEHGVLGSSLMDGGKIHKYGYEMFHYNDTVTPIWTLNQMSKGRRHSGCYMWPGCGLQYRGIDTTYSASFNQSVPWQDRIQTAISWLADPTKPANLVMLYFESPDFEEHIYGPDSNHTVLEIRRADEALGRIVAGLKLKNLSDVNVVVLSDHGMETVPMSKLINVTDILDDCGRSLGGSPVLQIFPEVGKLDDLYSKLSTFSKTNQHFDVYLNQEIPDRYRFKNCKRAPPILAVAKPGYAFLDSEFAEWLKDVAAKYKLNLTKDKEFGFHGYDPAVPSMQPFLMASGPHFTKNSTLPDRTVDLFGLFRDVLQIGSGGTKKPLPAMILQPKVPAQLSLELVQFSVACVMGLTTLVLVYILLKRSGGIKFRKRAGKDTHSDCPTISRVKQETKCKKHGLHLGGQGGVRSIDLRAVSRSNTYAHM